MNPIALTKSARELAGLFIMSYWFPVSFITGSELWTTLPKKIYCLCFSGEGLSDDKTRLAKVSTQMKVKIRPVIGIV